MSGDKNYFNFQNKIEPARGTMLISEPFLPDPNFVRTVILLCEHNQEGSFGFVLNKLSTFKLGDLVEEISGLSSAALSGIYYGGPVQQNTLHYIYRRKQYLDDSIEISDGLYWGGNYEQLLSMLKNNSIPPEDFKFFIGYSGWSPGQLNDELGVNSWIVSRNFETGQVFDTQPSMLWKAALERLGGKFKVISTFPVDPRLN
ncbi:MAG: YqgE/AlgH family protein [Cyclobacteriaceae bacterium]